MQKIKTGERAVSRQQSTQSLIWRLVPTNIATAPAPCWERSPLANGYLLDARQSQQRREVRSTLRKRRRPFENPLANRVDFLAGQALFGGGGHAGVVVFRQQLEQYRVVRLPGDDDFADRDQQTMVHDLDAALGDVELVALIAVPAKNSLGRGGQVGARRSGPLGSRRIGRRKGRGAAEDPALRTSRSASDTRGKCSSSSSGGMEPSAMR